LTTKKPLERVQESNKLLEKITLIVPGFRGYKQREERREADRIVRDHVYRVLEGARDDLNKCFQALSDSKTAELMEPMNRLIAQLDRVAEKVNHASYGYSGFFDAVKVEEADLDRMLSHDEQLTEIARKFSEGVTSFRNDLDQNRFEDARTTQRVLDGALITMEKAFDERKSVIEGVAV
jgi:DNA repair ATPase RecN